ncbi:hypothetical protein O6H91_02G053100 [Diphasiastrum complanatum]|uniref:Uncharacterized protein n=1 Tax=Diphasiastrum complanatum TaxID=34168 RepID=A0ACC2EFT6_DIPCM|nr:hypothetical protein O6H91_02G053100 [Diphasiastrum complanatum]
MDSARKLAAGGRCRGGGSRIKDIGAALGNVEALPNQRSRFAAFAFLLQRCANSKALCDGRLIHAHLTRHNYDTSTYLANWVVKMYGDCGSLAEARAVVDCLPNANAYSWNILIKAYCKNGLCRQAVECFYKMQRCGIAPTHVSFVSVLEACASMAALEEGKLIHAAAVKAGYEGHVVVGTALLNLYGKCGSLEDARIVFRQMPNRDVVTWSAMITACAQNGHGKEALEWYNRMEENGIRANQFTFVSALDACASLAALEQGQKIHTSVVLYGYERQAIVGTALVHMYGKCRRLEDARRVFDQLHQRDVVCWGAMITACAQNGHGKEALNLFSRMQSDGFKANHITYASALDACASLAALEKGQELHASIVDSGLEGETGIGNALVDMYGKCGNLKDARTVFSRMRHRDLVSWNAMIGACAQNGHGEEALDFFHQMRSKGVKPDHLTFLSILTACKHVGWMMQRT